MNPLIKSRFLSNPLHQQITNEINFLNSAGIDIFEQVYNYRTELGKTLQQLLECFSVIFLKQYEVFNQTENEKDSAATQKQLLIEQQERDLKENERELASKTEMIKKLIESKDQEIYELQTLNSELMQQNAELGTMVEEEWRER